MAVNKVDDTPALTRTLAVRSRGLESLVHYDLRKNTADPATPLADVWMLTGRDGPAWAETRVSSASLDISQTPLTDTGFFLGDYPGLVSACTTAIPVFAATTGCLDNGTDIYAPRLGAASGVTGATYATRSLSCPCLRPRPTRCAAATTPPCPRP